MLHVLLSGTPRVRIAPGTPTPRKHCVFGGFSLQMNWINLEPVWARGLHTVHRGGYPFDLWVISQSVEEAAKGARPIGLSTK